ncbi:MAG: hypothetical protein ACKOEI_06925 [Chthoniobacterales bacterium]
MQELTPILAAAEQLVDFCRASTAGMVVCSLPVTSELGRSVLPDAVTRLREAQKIATGNKKAAAKLKAEYEADRAWQRAHDREV